MKITPLPWTQKKELITGPKGNIVADCLSYKGPTGNLLPYGCREDNAEHIVNVVNNQPHVLAALEAVILWAKTPGNHGGNPWGMAHVKLADKALHLIKGTPPNRCSVVGCTRSYAYPASIDPLFCKDHLPLTKEKRK